LTTDAVPIEQDASLPEAPQAARAHRTKAQADRERRCIVSGEVVPEEKLIRFVAGPGGVVVPDLARKLPGRGLWVTANRETVMTAAKKGAFSRAAKAKLSAPADLADQVERLLTQRVLDGLGLARRAADLTFGFEKAGAAISAGKVAWMVEASDGADDGRNKVRHLAPDLPLIDSLTSAEIGAALGAGAMVHAALTDGRLAREILTTADKLGALRRGSQAA